MYSLMLSYDITKQHYVHERLEMLPSHVTLPPEPQIGFVDRWLPRDVFVPIGSLLDIRGNFRTSYELYTNL